MFDPRDYPHVWPPPGFTPIDRNASVVIPKGTTLKEIEKINLPIGQEGWIVLAGIEMSSYAAGTRFYQLARNDEAVRDYGQITVPLGAPNTPAPLYLKLLPNQKLQLKAQNTGALDIVIRYRLFGWYFPRRAQ